MVIGVGGVGVRVEVAEGRVPVAHAGQMLFLHTHLVVREDSLTLYGFATVEELEVFGLLLGVSGVGPRSALGALAALTPAQIARAVQLEDDRTFRQISGVGPKTAKLIALSLAGKLIPQRYLSADAPDESASGSSQTDDGSAQAEVTAIVTQGLIGLGYAESHAEGAVADAVQAGVVLEHSALLRAALALLQAPRSVKSLRESGR